MISRRNLLKTTSAGFGYLAFAGLAGLAKAQTPVESQSPLAPKQPHFPATAKSVIFLCMSGGPSHVDTFDYKPQLTSDNGKAGRYGGRLLASPFEFSQHGESGLWISELFPNIGSHADDLTLIRSMQCDQPVHTGALTQMHTGTVQFVRPSLGAWSLYGLGTENADLPGFVSLNAPAGSSRNFSSSFLPAIYGGTKIGKGGRRSNFSGGESIPDIQNPRLSASQQRVQLDLIQQLNSNKLKGSDHQPDVEGVIESYELAFRMQDALPEVLDVAGETKSTLEMYGIGNNQTDSFGKQCLLARRLVESGVRFVELTLSGWDQHRNLTADHRTRAQSCDKPIAGLLSDLKSRGLLDDTLVIWGGEFGRTPAAQSGDGRNHNNKGYTTWMAGGGVKGGFSYGATDEHGYEAVEDVCHIHDWHATILHLMGLDHKKLTYNYAGRDFRLTDVYGKVAHDIIA